MKTTTNFYQFQDHEPDFWYRSHRHSELLKNPNKNVLKIQTISATEKPDNFW